MSWDPYTGVRLELPFVPASKKNTTQIKTGRGGRPYPAKGDAVRAHEAEIGWIAHEALRRLGRSQPLFAPDAALRAELTWCPELEVVVVHVRQVGVLMRRMKRDAANIPASVLDALQERIYDDDRQVVELEVVTDLEQWNRRGQ